jgi:hypothetical protein
MQFLGIYLDSTPQAVSNALELFAFSYIYATGRIARTTIQTDGLRVAMSALILPVTEANR